MGRRFVVTFHGLGAPPAGTPPDEVPYWVSGASFEGVLDELAAEIGNGLEVTFDDGFASDLEVALPALVERDLKGRFFVLAGHLGAAGRLGPAQLSELVSAGMTVGSHGMQHRRWAGLGVDDLRAEVVDARRSLEDVVQAPVDEAACPFGSYDRRSLRALRDAGFRTAFTSDPGWSDERAWLRNRNTVVASLDPGGARAWARERGGAAFRGIRALKTWIKSHR
ncbi:MAG: polysaccharide deacetylase family protein [Planctomycetota bacterium]